MDILNKNMHRVLWEHEVEVVEGGRKGEDFLDDSQNSDKAEKHKNNT